MMAMGMNDPWVTAAVYLIKPLHVKGRLVEKRDIIGYWLRGRKDLLAK